MPNSTEAPPPCQRTGAPVSLELVIEDEGWQAIENLHAAVHDSACAALARAGHQGKAASLTISLSGDNQVRALNNRWRGRDRPTNVLSFPAAPGSVDENERAYLGDIIVALGVVQNEAQAQGKPLVTHLCHLVVHGVLHLLGHDHQNDDEAQTMEQMEINAMADLGFPDPYRDRHRD